MRVAAIDVGTNTVRLLVRDASGDVERTREITRLGQGVDADRKLHPDVIARTVDAIEKFSSRARDLGAAVVRIAGTSALRDSSNRDAFAEAIRQRTGVDLEVLSGAEEGRLSYLGATAELPRGDYVVCDIGGGSTELSTRSASRSLNIGSVRLRERFLSGDPPTREQVDEATDFIRYQLVGVELPAATKLVGVAGTITTLGALEYLPEAVHLGTLWLGDVVSWSARLLTMKAEEIAALGPVESGRADVIGAGSLILRCVMENWNFGDVLVSERDILDGLVLDLA